MTQQNTAPRAQPPWALTKLKPLPSIALELMRLVAGDEIVFRQASDLIRLDPAFSAEVLRIANSPLLGAQCKIKSILHALAMLGLDRLKSIVMAVALRDLLSHSLHVPSLKRCWRHSLACAFLCEHMAAGGKSSRDASYTLGLLHDMGRLALMSAHPEAYARLLDAAEGSGWDMRECERGRFGLDHCAAGEWLVRQWLFPPEFAEAALRHHEDPPDGFQHRETATVRLACQLADAIGFQAVGEPAHSLDQLRERCPAPERIGELDQMVLHVAEKINALECTLFC